MFTGIIQTIGEVTAFTRDGNDARIEIAAPEMDFNAVDPGASVAVNGVCLTVTAHPGDGFCADVSSETLARTTLGNLRPAARVNLELPATPSTLLGGHIVQGHVDGVGEIMASRDDGRSVQLEIALPAALARYVATKGSITVDGVSLTVNTASERKCGVNIIPHTLTRTIIADYERGTRVNLECDIIARYLERLHSSHVAS